MLMQALKKWEIRDLVYVHRKMFAKYFSIALLYPTTTNQAS
jgi:hypothetical protein